MDPLPHSGTGGHHFTQFKNAAEITEYLVPYFRRLATHRGRLPLLESGLFEATRAAQSNGRRVTRREIEVSSIAEEKTA
jgi:hypothetical protein